jgi:hypothetical protein
MMADGLTYFLSARNLHDFHLGRTGLDLKWYGVLVRKSGEGSVNW